LETKIEAIYWDHESDVIIIGGGTGGLPAAITAAEGGQKATVLEWRPQCGGSLGMIVGAIAFAGTDEQKAAGIEDSPELLAKDMIAVGAIPEIAYPTAEAQLEAYNIFKSEGFKWPGIVSLPGHSATRGMGWILNYGPAVVKCLENRARKAGAEILFHHRATRLIQDPLSRRVIGVVVETKGKTLNFKAKKGVIIASGGFGRNKNMIAEYSPNFVNFVPKMPVSHMGDGLKMALQLGAATKDIGIAVAGSWPVSQETHSRCIWALDWGGIMVNIYGKRFFMESSEEGFYGRMTEAAHRQPGGYYWVIFDQWILDNVGTSQVKGTIERNMAHFRDIDNCAKVKANTPEELAKLAGFDVDNFKATLSKYNSDIEKYGYDTDFDRKYQFGAARKINKLNPPYYAAKCVTSITSVKGGIKQDSEMRVIDNYNDPIPALYAVGEAAGGLWSKSYILATMTSVAMGQGIIAAKNVIKEIAID
jgi:fumarate reductase flavoprotein subunit